MTTDVIRVIQQMQDLLGELASALEGGANASIPNSPGAATAAPTTTPNPRAERVYYGPAATYRTRDGVTLAIDGKKPHWVSTNSSGASLLRGCTGEHTVGDLASRLATRHGVPADDALGDTLTFLERLEAIGFIQQSPRLAPPYRGRTSAVRLGRLADLYLFLTNDCNLRCSHCYVSSGDYVPPREMSTQEIYGLIDQARELGVGRFLVTGGEPFMVRDIFEIIRYITDESDLVILTNGLFFSDKYLRRLSASTGRGKLSFQISIDGPTAALHDAIRGKGTFDKTVRAVRRAVDAGLELSISTAVSQRTLDYMTDTTRLARGLQRWAGISLRLACGGARNGMRQCAGAASRTNLARVIGTRPDSRRAGGRTGTGPGNRPARRRGGGPL